MVGARGAGGGGAAAAAGRAWGGWGTADALVACTGATEEATAVAVGPSTNTGGTKVNSISRISKTSKQWNSLVC